MRTTIKIEKNLGLSESKFAELIDQLKRGNELLFEKIFSGFFKKNLNILTRKYNAAHEDAYDCVMWAMLRMRQMLLENKVTYGNLDNYFTRMAVTRYIKSQSRKKEFATDTFPELGIGEENFVDNEALEILEKAWQQLGGPCRELLKGFYYDKIELKDLTEILKDTSTSNTRKRKERCLKKLKKLFFQYYK